MTKLKIWLLVLLFYLATFGTPIFFGYRLLLAEKPTQLTGFLYIVLVVVFVLLAKKISNAIKKMKASYTKAIFKSFLTLVLLYGVYIFVSYIGVNFTELSKLLIFTIIGRIVGLAFEILAVKIDASYVEEIGVL